MLLRTFNCHTRVASPHLTAPRTHGKTSLPHIGAQFCFPVNHNGLACFNFRLLVARGLPLFSTGPKNLTAPRRFFCDSHCACGGPFATNTTRVNTCENQRTLAKTKENLRNGRNLKNTCETGDIYTRGLLRSRQKITEHLRNEKNGRTRARTCENGRKRATADEHMRQRHAWAPTDTNEN